MTVQTNMYLAFANSGSARTTDGRLYLNGGELDVKGTMTVTRNSKSTAEAWLNPSGLLKAGDLTATRTGGKFYFNGGLFLPYGEANGTAKSLADSSLDLLVTTNGAVIGTANAKGGQYTVSAALKHDPALAGKDGGLVKTGAGLLVLSGANTYTGPTVVEGGMLAVSGTGTLGAGGGLAVARGAICDLGGTAQAVGDVVASGLVRNGTLTVGGAVCATADDVLAVYGDLAIANTAAVDFAAVPNADLAAGVPLAAVSGTAVLPKRVRALNAGTVRGVAFVRVGDLIYAVPAPNGTMVIFR